jgi:hypothetical protein
VQPANQNVNPGATATCTAAADANPPAAVRWQVSMDGGANWTDIEGATSTTLTLANVALSQNSHQYRAVFTNEVGSACTDAWPTSA